MYNLNNIFKPFCNNPSTLKSKTVDYGMTMAVRAKITLFTPVVAVSDEGVMPAFWANFLSISNSNNANIRKSIHCPNFMY